MANEPKITVTPLVCVSYKANSYTTEYHFVGKSEEEARKQLDDFLAGKAEKTKTVETPEGEVTVSAPSGRGAALVGSVWMIHHAKKLRERVPASELDLYLGRGYEKGGPRTKFRS